MYESLKEQLNLGLESSSLMLVPEKLMIDDFEVLDMGLPASFLFDDSWNVVFHLNLTLDCSDSQCFFFHFVAAANNLAMTKKKIE